MNNFFRISKLPILLVLTLFFLTSCGGWDPADSRDVPTGGIDRAKKNIKEGRGISLKGLTGNRSTTFEFGSSNPMWRPTFDVIDFMPLITVDYAGGMIITDWYTDKRAPSESLKFTIRFLSNDIRADSIKIIIHRRVCQQKTDCVIKKILANKTLGSVSLLKNFLHLTNLNIDPGILLKFKYLASMIL